MLTVQQADIVSLLDDFKYLRYSHVKKYMAAKHNSSDDHLSKMMKQLSFMGKIRVADNYVMLPGRRRNDGIIKAFDVVMDLTEGRAEHFYMGANPFTLMFSVKAGAETPAYNNFGVVIVERYCENSICGHLRSIDRELTVIFILSDMEQQTLIKTDNKHYFAVQDDNGKYKFFKAVNKPQTKKMEV